MISIVDVARKAGVSPATASRVLTNSNHPVSKETADRVLQAAAELGYVPSGIARALVSGSTRTVAVIVHDIADAYFSEIARGAEDAGARHGYMVMICNTDRDSRKEMSYLHTLLNFRVDGVIFAASTTLDEERETALHTWLEQMHSLDRVAIALSHTKLGMPMVRYDNATAAANITTYLLGLGHRRIAMIAGPADLRSAQERLQGYQRALRTHGVEPDDALVASGDYQREKAGAAVRQILDRNPDNLPTAIFAANDEMAIGALAELKRLGYSAPQQISLAGFGDIPIADYLEPPLTTVHLPLRELGSTAMEMLLRLRSKENASREVVLPTSLVVRASTRSLR